jgi:hypothetical protein
MLNDGLLLVAKLGITKNLLKDMLRREVCHALDEQSDQPRFCCMG